MDNKLAMTIQLFCLTTILIHVCQIFGCPDSSKASRNVHFQDVSSPNGHQEHEDNDHSHQPTHEQGNCVNGSTECYCPSDHRRHVSTQDGIHVWFSGTCPANYSEDTAHSRSVRSLHQEQLVDQRGNDSQQELGRRLRDTNRQGPEPVQDRNHVRLGNTRPDVGDEVPANNNINLNIYGRMVSSTGSKIKDKAVLTKDEFPLKKRKDEAEIAGEYGYA